MTEQASLLLKAGEVAQLLALNPRLPRAALEEERKEHHTESAQIADSWLGVQEAAVHAGVCEKTIRRAYMARQLEHTRIGRIVKFRRSWVDAWVGRERVKVVA